MHKNPPRFRFATALGLILAFLTYPLAFASPFDELACRKSFDSAPHPAEASPEIFAKLITQVCQPFERKFAGVTSDIRLLSDSNLQAISAALRLSLGADKYQSFWASTESMVELVRRHLVIQSETSLKSALSILETALFSKDELIRRKVIPIESKLHGATRYDMDGVIGQQDAVFLAIKPNDIQANHVGDLDYVFGDVKFIFDEDVLDKGYFTTYPFDNSPDEFHLRSQGTPNLPGAIDLYRKFLFKGKSALNELIHLSLVQGLSESPGKTPSLTQEVLGEYARFPRPLGLARPLRHGWSFWELKVPTQLSLDHLSAIQLRKSLTTEEIQQFIEQAEQFAKKSGRLVQIADGFDQIGYELSIARGAQANHEYYEFVRLQFVSTAKSNP